MVFKYNIQHHVVQILKPGKQGMVGIIYDKANNNCRIYKFSSLLNMNGTHEYNIIKSLLPLTSVCPYYPTNCELTYHELDSKYEESYNPFELKSKHKLFVDICLSEYVGKSRKFTTFIEHSKQVSDNIIMSLLKQTLMGILIANRYNNFTHYDLHSENILVQKCSYNDVYVWYDSKQGVPYVVPSLGYIPRIIDYGFSYSDALIGEPHTTPLDFMKEGYMSFRTDKFADFRIILTSMMEEMYYCRRYNDIYNIQKKIVKKLYKKTNIDWSSGWLKDVKACAVKYLYEMCSTCKYKDAIFESPTIDEHFYSILDLIQLLIPVPIKSDPFPDKSMKQVFEEFLIGIREFVKHFYKLEGLFEANTYKEDEYEPNPIMGLYIIRASVDAILATRTEYNGPGQSTEAVRKFKNKIYDVIRHANTVYQVPKINYEKYMVSFYVMANALQSLLYREIQYREIYIEHQYHKMPVENNNDIFYILNHYMNIPYYYNQETRFILMDDQNMCSKIYSLSQQDCFDLNASKDTELAQKVYNKISELEPIHVNKNGEVLLDTINKDVSVTSPSNTVCMEQWSDSDNSNESSDEEDFDVKYTWKHSCPNSDIEYSSKYDLTDYGHESNDE